MKKLLSERIRTGDPANRRVKMSIEAIAWKQMIALMCTKQATRAEIRAHTGLSQTTVNRWLAVLRTRPNNLIYVSEYTRSATVGPYTEHYSFGFCEHSVPRPAPLTKRERSAKVRRKLRTVKIQATGVTRHESQ